jgi:DNA-binding HxlR family transcriptional regulator
LYGSNRFIDFQAAIPGISPTMLTKRLRDLEEKGVVEKQDHDYLLTQCGEDLAPLIRQYAIWGMRWALGQCPMTNWMANC